MEEFDCLQSYVCRRVTLRPTGNDPFVKGQLTYVRASMHQTRSPQCFRYGINQQILFEVGMRADIERFIEGMPDRDARCGSLPFPTAIARQQLLLKQQKQTANLLNLFSLSKLKYSSVTCACINKLHCIPCLLFVLKIVRVINFRGFHYPRKIFNNEIFPDYGICN